MLRKRLKNSRAPRWTEGWQPSWVEGQWIVVFVDRDSAARALPEMQHGVDEPLDSAPMPDGSNCWYVGVAD